MEKKQAGASNTPADQEKREQHLKDQQSLSSNDPVEGKPDKAANQGTSKAPGQGGLSGDDPAEGSAENVKQSKK